MVIDYVRVYQNNLNVEDHTSHKFDIYPNPTSDFIHIKTEAQIERLELYNYVGQLILTKNYNANHVNIKSLNSGLYILKIYTDEGTSVSKKVLVDY